MYTSSNNNNSLTLGTRTTFTKSEWFAYRRSPTLLRLPDRRLAPPRLHSVGPSSSQPLDSSTYTSTVGSPPPPPLISPSSFTRSHLLLLNVIACSVAVSATWLFCSAIPALLAFKRAAESMEKLLDVTREELPGTMAAVRLSGMEISDLTMELSDLGQQLTQGVRGSTRAVRLAEERLRQFTNTSPSASMQEVVTLGTKTPEPTVAKIARSTKEKVVQGRAIWKMFFTLIRFSRTAHKYFASRGTS